jgi:hypothetical protein
VVKFNYHQDRECVRLNAKKLRWTRIGISEQFPEEIESIHKTLYPELKKAKLEGKRAKIVRDKLIIEGQVFNRYNSRYWNLTLSWNTIIFILFDTYYSRLRI